MIVLNWQVKVASVVVKICHTIWSFLGWKSQFIEKKNVFESFEHQFKHSFWISIIGSCYLTAISVICQRNYVIMKKEVNINGFVIASPFAKAVVYESRIIACLLVLHWILFCLWSLVEFGRVNYFFAIILSIFNFLGVSIFFPIISVKRVTMHFP